MSDTESTEMNDLLDKFEEDISNKFNLRIQELEDKIKNLENEKLKNDSSITIYTHTYPNGDIYEGTGLNKNNIFVRDGIGKMTYANGEIYSGCWKNNKRRGKGKLLKKGSLKIGVWNNDEIDGNSKETNYNFENANSGTVINNATIMEFKNGKPKRHSIYMPANKNQYTVGPYSHPGICTYDDSGNGSKSIYIWGPYRGYDGVDCLLDVSPNTLYL